MLNIQKFPLNQPAAERIRRWLGADGAADFMAWLVTLDAVLTAEAGNLMLESSGNESAVDDARAKAKEADEIRRFIGRINLARTKEFQFERCEITVATNEMNQPIK